VSVASVLTDRACIKANIKTKVSISNYTIQYADNYIPRVVSARDIMECHKKYGSNGLVIYYDNCNGNLPIFIFTFDSGD
jgi:hypothetical protein